jgi:hypothetical protein
MSPSNGATEPSDRVGRVRRERTADPWGWLPTLSLTCALGLLLVALADSDARGARGSAALLFWAGLLVLFVPVALRLGSSRVVRCERIELVALLALGLYVVKVLHSPLFFTFHDELVYWRTTNDVAQSDHLFHENPLLPVSPFYPGLAIAATALASTSGLTIFGAGIVAIGVARLVMVLTLFLLYERVSGSARVAGIASLLYMANPNFVFFSGEYSYESLALCFAALALFAAACRERQSHDARVGFTLAILAAVGALVITHHLSSYAFAGFFILWTLAAFRRKQANGGPPSPGGIAVLAVVAALAWLVYVATLTMEYVTSGLGGGLSELIRLIAGEVTARQLFRDTTGQVPPLWEQLASSASVGLILLGLPFGLLQLWRRHRADALALALAGAALTYPASLALRLTNRGAETSNRASEFLFVAIAFVLALGVVELWPANGPGWRRPAVFTGWATVIFAGGTILGWAPWARLPGPYLVAADTRSVESQGLIAAEWARASLGPGNRITADRTNRLLMGSYGEQRPVTSYGDSVDVPTLYTSPEFGPAEQTILQEGGIHYIVVDGRLTTALPMVGAYFEDGEEGSHRYSTPLDQEALWKFDRLQKVSRLFDSGDISIYDVGALAATP